MQCPGIYRHPRLLYCTVHLVDVCLSIGFNDHLGRSSLRILLPRASRAYGALRWSPSPQPDTSRSRKTTYMGLVHHVVCPFTPQFSLVLINRPRRDGTLSWRWCTAQQPRVGFEPTTSRSQVRHRTTRPPRILKSLVYYHSLDGASVLVFTELVGKSSSSFC